VPNKPKAPSPSGSHGNEHETPVPIKKLSELVLAILDTEDLAEDVETAIWTLLKYLRKEGK